MTITDSADGKEVVLSKAFDSRAKILYIIYFIAFTLTGLFLGNAFISIASASAVSIIIIGAIVAVYLFAGYRFINKAVQAECLLVAKDRLVIFKIGFLSSKKDSYDINNIYAFRHPDKPEATKHPLAGQSFDYLGFQTGQQVANEMHGDKRLAFDYNGKTIAFGENIYSWDFEALQELILDITGKDITSRKEVDEIAYPSE
jgi:prepilin signal peptidase PulO-like enzyme (type II secretory pathway)